MRSDLRRWIPRAFLLALWLPLLAVLASPGFSPFLRAVHHDPASFDAERNRLRQATPLWSGAVAAYNQALYAIGVSGRPGAAEVGRDGWLFLGDIFNANFSQALGRRVLDHAEVDHWTGMLALQQQRLAARGIAFAFVVAPAKWSVYPECLPAWSADLHASHSLDRLLAAPAAAGLPIVDLREPLRAAKTRAPTYSPLDSHWTDFGAWVAWTAIANDLHRRYPTLPVLPTPALRSVQSLAGGGEFEAMLGIAATNRVTRVELSPALSAADIVTPDDSLQPMAPGSRTDLLDLPRETRNAQAATRLRALILRDSTGNALSPYWQDAFESTYQVDHRLGDPAHRPDLARLVDDWHPDLVLWVMTERYFNESPGSPYDDDAPVPAAPKAHGVHP